MQLINVTMGGKLLQDFPGHRTERDSTTDAEAVMHQIYVSPGSRLGAIIGAGAIYRTNSLHHQGIKEPQRALGLMASAYHIEDGIIEAVESMEHPWLIGVQCHPEREREVPKSFLRLFDWLVGWAERYESGDMPG
jgi:putative glutamine amidotransferase